MITASRAWRKNRFMNNPAYPPIICLLWHKSRLAICAIPVTMPAEGKTYKSTEQQ